MKGRQFKITETHASFLTRTVCDQCIDVLVYHGGVMATVTSQQGAPDDSQSQQIFYLNLETLDSCDFTICVAHKMPLYIRPPCLRNDLYCVGWGVKLYSLTHPVLNLRMTAQWHVLDLSVQAIMRSFLWHPYGNTILWIGGGVCRLSACPSSSSVLSYRGVILLIFICFIYL